MAVNKRWSTEAKQGSDSGRPDKSSDAPVKAEDKTEDDVSGIDTGDWVAQYQTKEDPDTHRETIQEECQNFDRIFSGNNKPEEKQGGGSTSTKT